MKFGRPRHSTVVAYLALFAALGGTAIAARDTAGAKELRPLVVRKAKTQAGPGAATAVVRCRANEQLVSGGGGWSNPGGATDSLTVTRAAAIVGGQRSSPKGFVLEGRSSTPSNTLVAQAICLPK